MRTMRTVLVNKVLTEIMKNDMERDVEMEQRDAHIDDMIVQAKTKIFGNTEPSDKWNEYVGEIHHGFMDEYTDCTVEEILVNYIQTLENSVEPASSDLSKKQWYNNDPKGSFGFQFLLTHPFTEEQKKTIGKLVDYNHDDEDMEGSFINFDKKDKKKVVSYLTQFGYVESDLSRTNNK